MSVDVDWFSNGFWQAIGFFFGMVVIIPLCMFLKRLLRMIAKK